MSKISADIDACVNLSQMTQQWEETEPLHQARGFHASCVHENRVYVAGGSGEIGARATDRQTDRQTGRQTDRQTDRHKNRDRDRDRDGDRGPEQEQKEESSHARPERSGPGWNMLGARVYRCRALLWLCLSGLCATGGSDGNKALNSIESYDRREGAEI
jgi:hypothetical protein